MEGKANCAVHL